MSCAGQLHCLCSTSNNSSNQSGDAFGVAQVEKNHTAWTPDQKLNEILDKVTKKFFPVKHAYRRQCVLPPVPSLYWW
jgi:hypothetical protein